MERIYTEAINELLTLGDLLRWGAGRFNAANLYFGHGTDNAWDEAVLLALHALHLPPDVGKEMIHSRLTTTERRRIVELFALRITTRMPAAYLIRKAWFAGLQFYVDNRVLVPRSPLAEVIERQFSPWVEAERIKSILDLCTGSGCIGIASAFYFPEANVDLVDISEAALIVARRNILQHGLQDRVRALQSDLFSEFKNQSYDIIISNPPYVGTAELQSLPAEYRHEPRIGLAAGNDGLQIVRRILAQASDYLSDAGVLVVEVGNTMVSVMDAFPDVPFTWLEFERGGDGVFLLTKEQLIEYKHCFL